MTNSFPNIFKELIERNNTTIKAVADYVGATRQAVSQYANGKTQPNIDVIIKIAEYFEVTTDFLLGVTPSQKERKPMTVEQAIKELNEQKVALDKHIARGATYCDGYAEALEMGIKALEMRLYDCILTQCIDCPLYNLGGKACEHYADKVDEIRRIHGEAENA